MTNLPVRWGGGIGDFKKWGGGGVILVWGVDTPLQTIHYQTIL